MKSPNDFSIAEEDLKRLEAASMQDAANAPIDEGLVESEDPLANLLKEDQAEERPVPQSQPLAPQMGPSRVDYDMQSAFGKDLSDEELKKLLQNQKDTMASTGLQRGAMAIIQASANKDRTLAGLKTDNETDPYGLLADRERQAEQPLKALAARRSAQKQDVDAQQDLLKKQETQEDYDPNSPKSKMFQQAARRIGLDKVLGAQLDSIPASAIAKYLPMDLQMQAIEANKDLAQARLEESRDARADRKEAKDAEQVDKAFTKLAERIDPAKSIRGNLGSEAQKSFRAQAGLKLIEGKDFSKVNDIELKELARQLEAVISGGVGTISGAKALLPHTAQGSFTDAMQWVRNKPQGRDQKEFVALFVKALKNQDIQAQQNVKKMQSEIMRTADPKLKKKDPERWSASMDEIGLDQNGRVITKQPEAMTPKPEVPAQPGDRVTVVSPSGKRGSIPRSQLEAAKAQGYKVQ